MVPEPSGAPEPARSTGAARGYGRCRAARQRSRPKVPEPPRSRGRRSPPGPDPPRCPGRRDRSRCRRSPPLLPAPRRCLLLPRAASAGPGLGAACSPPRCRGTGMGTSTKAEQGPRFPPSRPSIPTAAADLLSHTPLRCRSPQLPAPNICSCEVCLAPTAPPTTMPSPVFLVSAPQHPPLPTCRVLLLPDPFLPLTLQSLLPGVLLVGVSHFWGVDDRPSPHPSHRCPSSSIQSHHGHSPIPASSPREVGLPVSHKAGLTSLSPCHRGTICAVGRDCSVKDLQLEQVRPQGESGVGCQGGTGQGRGVQSHPPCKPKGSPSVHCGTCWG